MDAAIAMLASRNLTPAAFVAGLAESEEYDGHTRDLFTKSEGDFDLEPARALAKALAD